LKAGGTPLLEVRSLGRRVGERQLWRQLSFSLAAGERLAVVAPSGAGKTLLMRSLALLDPLQEGELRLLGRTPAAWGLPCWRSRVCYLAQRPATFTGTVEDNLRMVFRYAVHRFRQWHPPSVIGWLQRLGRNRSFLDLQAERLSGGEAQLLALLRALQLQPGVLLLDEPTASLDATTTAAVEELLALWLAEGERACLLTSHDGEQIRRFASRELQLGPGGAP
jgi:putative ABC transport system ATP-binding protein